MKNYLILSALMLATAIQAREPDTTVLLRSYVRFSLAQEVLAQAKEMMTTMDRDAGVQIEQAAEAWFDEEVQGVRVELERAFGASARDRFAAFVADFTTAEGQQDETYLIELAQGTGLMEPPGSYAALRRLALERWLGQPFQQGTRLLSELQTWSELRKTQNGTPPLDAWLDRNMAPAPEPPPPKRPVNPLADAEAAPAEWSGETAGTGSSLDAFSTRRRQKREQALMDAQAGMQQMAMERQAAEQEYGAKKMAAAQAEAEAMRAQAQKMASTEAEALAQRENSWGTRIKRIVSGTLGAGIGAFTGGVGAEAGKRAADELFR